MCASRLNWSKLLFGIPYCLFCQKIKRITGWKIIFIAKKIWVFVTALQNCNKERKWIFWANKIAVFGLPADQNPIHQNHSSSGHYFLIRFLWCLFLFCSLLRCLVFNPSIFSFSYFLFLPSSKSYKDSINHQIIFSKNWPFRKKPVEILEARRSRRCGRIGRAQEKKPPVLLLLASRLHPSSWHLRQLMSLVPNIDPLTRRGAQDKGKRVGESEKNWNRITRRSFLASEMTA